MKKYSRVTRWLHWGSALVIIYALISGMLIATLNLPVELKRSWSNVNVVVTFAYFPVLLFRLAWQSFTKQPAPPDWNACPRCSRLAHCSLYLCLFIVMISGIAMLDREIIILGSLSISPLPLAASLKHSMSQIHLAANLCLSLQLLLHLLTLVWYQKYKKRPLLARMR